MGAPLHVPPVPPSVFGQQSPLASLSQNQPTPTGFIEMRLNQVADEIRRLMPMIRQAKPEAVVYFEKGLQAWALGTSALKGEEGSISSQGPPAPPGSPLEPPVPPETSAAPPLEGRYPGA
jgi:hypothetical protein